jgi:hypothetical protein
MKLLYLFLALALSAISPVLAAPLSTDPMDLQMVYSTPFTYNQGLTSLVWTPGAGSKFVGFVRWVRPGAAPLLVPQDGQSYGHGSSTSDLSPDSYVGNGTYAFLKGEVAQGGPGSMRGYLRNLLIGHTYEVSIYEYDSVAATGATYYRPIAANLTFTAGRFVPKLSGVLSSARVPTLTWSTASQYKCVGFQPEVSADGVTFSDIGSFVPGVDSTYSSVRTSQPLSAPILVTTYYRIRITNADVTQYSNVLRLTPPVPLPVELTRFAGELLAAGNARLFWNTASERDAAYFEVQRSTDGQLFRAVGRRDAAGTSTAAHAYQLVDPARLTGVTYYRLLQVDADGTGHYSPVITLQGSELAFGLSLFPNPAQLGGQRPVLRCTGAVGEVLQVAVFDLSGRRVAQQQVPVASAFLDTPLQLPTDAATGVYLVHVATTGGRQWQGRLSLDR